MHALAAVQGRAARRAEAASRRVASQPQQAKPASLNKVSWQDNRLLLEYINFRRVRCTLPSYTAQCCDHCLHIQGGLRGHAEQVLVGT